ncbi:kelch domain-containing protein 7B [Ochotona curzoniae]|uniref:kelch domain-containing protein 7B n=1 Tax=Ochotona curzoniae TaxID=130825 RepID=UPI001B34EF7A|nr:kelch domain-containing protein 7B [Ochotona curzoniae]
MSQGTLEAGGPLWGWDWDAEDDWEGAVLAVLALAVVAATALALHWFGPQDQQAARPTPQAAGVGPALHLKAQVSGGHAARSPEQGKSGPLTCSQGSPTATTRVQGCEPRGGEVLHPQARLCKGALGLQQSPAKEPPRPGADHPSRDSAAGLPAPVVIHFTLREVEAQLEAGGGREGLEQRGRVRSRRRQVDAGSGDRTRRRPKPDPLCMGAVPSVWDEVEKAASAGLDAAPRELSQGRAPNLGAAPVSRPRPVPQEARVALQKGSQERQVLASWGTLIAMVLRSHPFPRQEKLPGRDSSLCELTQSCEQETVGQGTSGLSPGQATKEEALTQKQREARKLLAFLQRPGSWGVAEGVRGPCTLEPARAAALRRRLDLGNCLDVLALAQQRGDASLARETYAVMSNNLLHVLGDAQLYRQLSGADRQRILNLRTGRGRTVLGVLVLPSLYPVSRLGSGAEEPAPAGSTQLHVFSPQENSWWPLTRVPDEAPLRGCGLCTMHNYLFLAGGIRGSGAEAVCSNQVFCYNPLTDIWSQVRPMRQARAQLKLVAVDGLLYAIGGECLYSMECYDPRTDAWTPRAPLPAGTFPVAHEAVACRGDIYVTGGHLFYRLLRYSPRKDSWDECPYSASHRRSSDMVALGGFLYRFDLLRGVGAAVMRYNTVTGSWSRAASLPLPDPAPLRCAVLGNTIYCLNHQVTATFTVSEGTAQFQAQELQPFPLGSKGTLSPFLLTLPSKDPLQTSL